MKFQFHSSSSCHSLVNTIFISSSPFFFPPSMIFGEVGFFFLAEFSQEDQMLQVHLNQKSKAIPPLQSPLSFNLWKIINGLFLKGVFSKTNKLPFVRDLLWPSLMSHPLPTSFPSPLTRLPLLPCLQMDMNKSSPAVSGIFKWSRGQAKIKCSSIFQQFTSKKVKKDLQQFSVICKCHQDRLRDQAYVLEPFAFILLNQKETNKNKIKTQQK